jgi:hypothetical protein
MDLIGAILLICQMHMVTAILSFIFILLLLLLHGWLPSESSTRKEGVRNLIGA